MVSEVYVRLREKLDTLGVGYPATETGIEYTFLTKLFTPEEAELFIAMPDEFHTAKEFAASLGKDPQVLADKLEGMAQKGLLYRVREESGVKYRVPPIIVGLFEFNAAANRIDQSMLPDFFGHFVGGLGQRLFDTDTPIVRAIPVKTDIVVDNKVLPIDDAELILRKHKHLAVSECVCRKMGKLLSSPCTHSINTCLAMGDTAKYYVENGWGKYITVDEALAIIKDGDEKGRVVEVVNSQDAEFMCSCCSCCCASLKALEISGVDAVGRPHVTNYSCVRDETICVGTCSDTCTGRCPTHAQKLVDGSPQIDPKLCIGCGLCVTTCPTGALSLVKKPDDAIYNPPAATLYDSWDAQARYVAAQKQADSKA